jgi:ATP-binding cassette subfamily B protein
MSSSGRFARAAVRAGRWWTVAAVSVSAIGDLLAAVLPAVLALAVNRVLAGEPAAAVVLILALVLAGLLAAEVGGQYLVTTGTAVIAQRLRRQVIAHLARVGPVEAGRIGSGDLVSRVTADTATTAGELTVWTASASMGVATVAGLLGLAAIDPWTLLVVLAAAPVGCVLATRFVADTASDMRTYLDAYGTIAGRAVGALSGIRTIAGAGTVQPEVRRILGPLPHLSRAGHRFWRAQGEVSWQFGLLLPAVQFGVLTIVGFGVANGRTQPGQMLAAAAYASMALGVLGLAQIATQRVRTRAAAARVIEVLHLPVRPSGSRPAPEGTGSVLVRGLTVRSGGRTVLDGIDLTVPGGTSIALVGGAESGASTLAGAIAGLIEPDAGEVLVDGVPLRELSARAASGMVSSAFARPHLIGRTVADALRLGAALTDREVESGAADAHADRFVRRLPKGYATPLADAPLSGGELQRLGLARAFARPSRVLVLDDAMSSLDTATEVHVSKVLTEKRRGRSAVVVGHRLGTAARCDLVAWLDRGRLRRVAPHTELWSDPAYRAVFGSAPVPVGA